MIYYGTESPTALDKDCSFQVLAVKVIHKLHTWYPACPSHYTAGDRSFRLDLLTSLVLARTTNITDLNLSFSYRILNTVQTFYATVDLPMYFCQFHLDILSNDHLNLDFLIQGWSQVLFYVIIFGHFSEEF